MSNQPEIIPTLNPVFAKRRAHRLASSFAKVWDLLDQVCDPELPGLTIWDLGILQDIRLSEETWEIDVTPTYSGCPAVDTINDDITSAMQEAGYTKFKINIVLAPAWCTDMISPAGKQALLDLHIAPPHEKDIVACPICASKKTKLISQFGSTGCKALYQCESCYETFDYFKHF